VRSAVFSAPHDLELLGAACVLVADDHQPNVALLDKLLRGGGVGRVHGVTDAREVVSSCLAVRPDLVVLDLHMPHVDGYAVLAALQEAFSATEFLPVLVLTADSTTEARDRALLAGAKDFLTKPFDRGEILLRVRNLLETRALYRRLEDHNVSLQAALDEQLEASRRVAEEGRQRRDRITRALAAGALEMVFQPIADLNEGRVVGVEALARFTGEPRRPPNEWFEEANATGLGVELELAAVACAVASFSRLPPGVFLAVNASPVSVVDGGLQRLISAMPSGNIVVELTEHNRVEDYAELSSSLEELRQAGVRVAVDDTGAGYAGLQHILRIRPDIIKLDIDLIRGLDTDPVRRALVASLVSFGADTDAIIIAEGIETAGQLDTLRERGVAWGQGYLLAEPGPLPFDPDLATSLTGPR